MDPAHPCTGSKTKTATFLVVAFSMKPEKKPLGKPSWTSWNLRNCSRLCESSHAPCILLSCLGKCQGVSCLLSRQHVKTKTLDNTHREY
jgi:hypothetical protein